MLYHVVMKERILGPTHTKRLLKLDTSYFHLTLSITNLIFGGGGGGDVDLGHHGHRPFLDGS